MKKNHNKYDISKLIFLAALAFVIFIIGGEFAKRGWQPWKLYEDGFRSAKMLIKQSRATHPEILEKIRYEGDGVTRYDPARAFNGYTLMQGWFTDRFELRLVDMSGKLVHRWPANFFKIWPNPSHVKPVSKIPATQYNYDIQGMWLLPDGSVVYNFSELGSVKMDKCGKVLWTVDRSTHHSVTYNPDGTFWIPEKNDPAKVSDDLLLFGYKKPGFLENGGPYEDRLLLISADGKILKEISVLRALLDSGLEHLLFDTGKINKADPTHINDIEVVTQALAKKIEGVSPGDLLVSLRQIHTLAILDRETGRLKWHKTGPWVRQHDVDITEDGLIEVFNNRTEYPDYSKKTDKNSGSNVMLLDPATGNTRVIYPLNGQEHFYTEIQGANQRLGNGNRMITESMAGRVFEVDKEGKVVWEYVKRHDHTYASWIEYAIRYPEDYFSVKNWTCQ